MTYRSTSRVYTKTKHRKELSKYMLSKCMNDDKRKSWTAVTLRNPLCISRKTYNRKTCSSQFSKGLKKGAEMKPSHIPSKPLSPLSSSSDPLHFQLSLTKEAINPSISSIFISLNSPLLNQVFILTPHPSRHVLLLTLT